MNDDLTAAFQKLDEQIGRIQRNLAETRALSIICLGAICMLALAVGALFG